MELLVAGAGIAGMAAAIAMTKAGHDVVLVERAPELREIGAALSLWPNALAALDRLGVGALVVDNGGAVLTNRAMRPFLGVNEASAKLPA